MARARTLLTLAGELEPHDAANAASLRQLASERTEQLVILERATIRRRFDPAGPFALGVLILPAGIAAYFAWTRSGWWTWPVNLVSAGWTVTIIAVGWSEFWEEHEEAEEKRSED